MLRLLPAALLVLGALSMAPVASASHYHLTDVDVFQGTLLEVFEAQGWQTTEDVLRGIVTTEQRNVLARASGVPQEELLQAARFLELMQIDGVGPRAARLLQAAGVTSARDLAQRNAVELLALLVATNEGLVYTSSHPLIGHVQNWIYEATQVDYHVQ
jgi:hypothetical protein